MSYARFIVVRIDESGLVTKSYSGQIRFGFTMLIQVSLGYTRLLVYENAEKAVYSKGV